MAYSLIRRISFLPDDSETWFHFPPYNGNCVVKFMREETQEIVRRYADAGERLVLSGGRLIGAAIGVSGQFGEPSVEDGLARIIEMNDALYDSSGVPRVGSLADWTDENAEYPGIWRNCRCVDHDITPEQFSALAPFQIQFKTPDIEAHLTAADGVSTPTAGTYESYIYNGAAVAAIDPENPDPGGDPWTPEVPAVPIADTRPFAVKFGPVAETTIAGNVHIFQKKIKIGTTYRVTGISISGCDATGSGTTRVCVSNTDYAGAGTVARVTVLANVGVSAAEVSVSSLAPDINGFIYVFLDQAGGHAGVEVQIRTVNA